MKKYLALLLALVMCIGLFAGCGSSSDKDTTAEDDNTVYIAVLEPLSGSNATNGELACLGFDMYVEYYMEKFGGIQSMNNAKIVLETFDTCSDKDTAITLFEKIVEDDKYCAVIGPYQSGVGTVLAPLAIQYEMPFMVANCTSDTVMTNGENKWVYRTNIGSFDGDPGMQYLFEYLDRLLPNGLNTIAVLYNNDDWGSAALKTYKALCEMYGIEIVIAEQIASDVSDLTTVVNRAKEADVDLVCTALYQDAHEILNRTMYEYGCDKITLSMGGGTSADNFLTNMGEAAENIIQAIGWAPTYLTTDEANAINDEYRAKTGQNMTMEMCWGWLGLGALIEGIEQAGSDDREAVADALYNLDVDASSGHPMFMFSFYEGVDYATEGQINTQDGTTRYNNNQAIGDAAGQVFIQVIDGEWTVVGPERLLEDGVSPIRIPDSYFD